MQLDRISYQYPDGTTAAYEIHRRLTVVDVHPAHRSALIEHLLAALSSESPGVHVEFTKADGKALVAFRPYGGAHRVIDLDDASDQTETYRSGDSVDVLAPLQLDADKATATLLATHRDLAAVDPTEGWMSRLLNHDVDRLLGAAEESVAAERALREATAAVQSTPETAAVVANVYNQREVATELEKRHNRIRIATLVIGACCPVGAVLGLNRLGTGPAMGIIAGSVLLALACVWYERKLARAVDAEYDALAAAGTDSYNSLDAQLNGSPLANPSQRTQLIDASERFRDTSARWQELAGDIPAPWVIAHRDRLVEMSGLRASLQPVPLPAESNGHGSGAAILAGLMARSEALKQLAPEALPLFLDEPLDGLDWSEKVPVLEFLNRLSEQQQVVLCTDDLEILGWARLEAMAGHAAVLDVNPGRSLTSAETSTGS